MQNQTVFKKFYYHPGKDRVESLHYYFRPAIEGGLDYQVIARAFPKRNGVTRIKKNDWPKDEIWNRQASNHLAQCLRAKEQGWQEITEDQYIAWRNSKSATAFQRSLQERENRIKRLLTQTGV